MSLCMPSLPVFVLPNGHRSPSSDSADNDMSSTAYVLQYPAGRRSWSMAIV